MTKCQARQDIGQSKTKLVVVDVSEDVVEICGGEGGDLLKGVNRQIEEAVAARQDIILVNYRGGVPVDERLIVKLSGYGSRHEVSRKYPDGAPEIAQLPGIDATEVFRLCGTYADACVHATAMGLAETFPNARIEIVTDA